MSLLVSSLPIGLSGVGEVGLTFDGSSLEIRADINDQLGQDAIIRFSSCLHFEFQGEKSADIQLELLDKIVSFDDSHLLKYIIEKVSRYDPHRDFKHYAVYLSDFGRVDAIAIDAEVKFKNRS